LHSPQHASDIVAGREHGAVLIFDEVSSAWRETLGGRHLLYGVEPDVRCANALP